MGFQEHIGNGAKERGTEYRRQWRHSARAKRKSKAVFYSGQELYF